MNSHQRRKARRAAEREIEQYARSECERYDINPDRWGLVAIKWDRRCCWLHKNLYTLWRKR